MKHLIIIKKGLSKSRQFEFDSLKALKSAGFSDRNFAGDYKEKFCVTELTDDGICDTEYNSEGKWYRIYCNDIDVDIVTN